MENRYYRFLSTNRIFLFLLFINLVSGLTVQASSFGQKANARNNFPYSGFSSIPRVYPNFTFGNENRFSLVEANYFGRSGRPFNIFPNSPNFADQSSAVTTDQISFLYALESQDQ
jgi:hypothetical protein